MDVSDIIDYNVGLLNPNDLSTSFFCLSQDDPTAGFAFDASAVAGSTFPDGTDNTPGKHASSLGLSDEERCGSEAQRHQSEILTPSHADEIDSTVALLGHLQLLHRSYQGAKTSDHVLGPSRFLS